MAYQMSFLQVDDLAAFTKHVRADYHSTMPMYLAGHSMGSLTCIHLSLRDQAAWDGLILGTATVDVEWNWVLKYDPWPIPEGSMQTLTFSCDLCLCRDISATPYSHHVFPHHAHLHMGFIYKPKIPIMIEI